MGTIFRTKVVDPVIDLATGRDTIRRHRELLKTQWYSEKELIEYQEKKLRSLIRHAYANTQFYHELFNANHIDPKKIRHIEDLEKLPIIDKNMIINHPHYPDCMLSHINNNYTLGHTSGTTGTPLIVAKDAWTRSNVWAAYWRWESWMGLKHGELTATIWSRPIVNHTSKAEVIRRIKDYSLNKINLNAYEISEENLQIFINKIIRKKPRHLHGYTTSVLSFCDFTDEHDISLPEMVVSTTAEILDKSGREKIGNCLSKNIFDQYGCGECGSLAFECGSHEGLHVTSEHVIIEGEKFDHNLKKCCLTDLDNYSMPLIRYFNGDIVEMSDEKCSCGRAHPLVKRIDGRSVDIIKLPNGMAIHHGYFINLLYDTGWYSRYKISKFQVVQERLDLVKIFLVLKNAPGPEDINNLKSVIKETFGDMDIDIEFVDTIPNEPSGKFRATKSYV